jgi:hypothetical protein
MYTIFYLDVDCVGPCELELVPVGIPSNDSASTILVLNSRSES